MPDNEPSNSGLPESIIGQFGPAYLHYFLPKIWTQKESRAFGIYWSQEANHGTLYPSPTEDELSTFYRQENYDRYLSGEIIAQYKTDPTLLERFLIKIAYWSDKGAQDPLTTILSYCAGKPSVCDLGCGGGTFLESIRPSASKTVGIDPSLISAASVKSRGIEFHQGTADNLPTDLAGESFDVVTMFHSLEHVRDVTRSLINAKSLLKPDGLLVVEVPNMECVGFKMYPEVWFHTDAGRHLQFFTKQSLETFCRKAGLEPFKWEFIGFTHQFLPDRYAAMRLQWDSLFRDQSRKAAAVRSSILTKVEHLARSMFASQPRKYDIVRMYAKQVL